MAEPLEGPTLRKYLDLGKEFRVWLSLGGYSQRHASVQRTPHALLAARYAQLGDVAYPVQPMAGYLASLQMYA